jgi:hypothetical protein
MENVIIALKQLPSLKVGTAIVAGCRQRATPRNTLFIIVSITNHSNDWLNTFLRSCSKLVSIGVFIVGTACFASVQLLSIAMATFVLFFVLAAGVFGRAIASWIVIGIEKSDPMIHFVADTNKEAHYVLARLFSINLVVAETNTPAQRKIQIELDGHVFLDKRRLLRRSPWPVRMLGIIASPFDLAGTSQTGKTDAVEEQA